MAAPQRRYFQVTSVAGKRHVGLFTPTSQECMPTSIHASMIFGCAVWWHRNVHPPIAFGSGVHSGHLVHALDTLFTTRWMRESEPLPLVSRKGGIMHKCGIILTATHGGLTAAGSSRKAASGCHVGDGSTVWRESLRGRAGTVTRQVDGLTGMLPDRLEY